MAYLRVGQNQKMIQGYFIQYPTIAVPNIVEVYYISSPSINLVYNPQLVPTHEKGLVSDYQWATSDKLISVSNNHAFVIIIFTNIIK